MGSYHSVSCVGGQEVEGMMKRLMLFLVVLAVLPIVNAGLQCELDSEPYIESDIPFLETLIYWSCSSSNMSDYSCSSFIQWNATLLQVNPKPKDVKDFGRVDKFSSSNKQVQVYFRPENSIIQPGQSYEFGVWCGDGDVIEKYNESVSPEYRGFDKPIEQTARLQENAPYIIASLVLLVLGVLALVVFRRTVKVV